MSLRVLPDLEQGTDEWLALRCGMVTASAVGQLITPTLGVADNDKSRGLTAVLTAERLTGHVDAVFVSDDMWRGRIEEPIARDVYAKNNAPVDEVGFMVCDDWGFSIGYSPDGLVGDDGLIEIKSRRQKKHLQTILADAVPPENVAQLQCGLLVSGRKWIDYVSFCAGMPLYVTRVLPDPAWHKAIVAAVQRFEEVAEQMASDYLTRTPDMPATERVALDLDIKVA